MSTPISSFVPWRFSLWYKGSVCRTQNFIHAKIAGNIQIANIVKGKIWKVV